jgi:hypothetical protein
MPSEQQTCACWIGWQLQLNPHCIQALQRLRQQPIARR